MLSTLAERLKTALTGPPKISQAALARACGVSPPSVNDWCSGKTKNIEGVYLVRAAAFLKVRPEWLAEGLGPMRLQYNTEPPAPLQARTPEPSPITSTERARARRLLESVPEDQLHDAIAHMEWLIERPKKTGSSNGNGRAVS